MSANIAALRAEVKQLNQALKEAEMRGKRYESLTRRTLSYINRMTGQDSISVLINQTLNLIQISEQAITVLTALQVARMAAGDPLAWFQFGVTTLGLGVSLQNQMAMRRPYY